MSTFQEKSSFIWNLADLLRGSYKRNEYQRVILPFTVLKRFDSVLEYSKKDVVDMYEKYKNITSNIDPILKNVAVDEEDNKLGFYNFSIYNFDSLLKDPDNIEDNIIFYLDCFSDNVKDIFENFDIKTEINNLSKANLLYLIVKKFSETNIDLSPKTVSNHEMGTIFEELIRKFSEQSNEEAGEHFTPRDVVKLMTELMFIEDDINEKESIKLIYDPACGTGGMLTSCKEFINNLNEDVDVVLYGQEINPEIYAICKADMLMKGENANNIKGPSSTLSDDQLSSMKFDYMISNPPYGRNWELDEDVVKKELKCGFEGRFGAGIPRKSDGQLLFIEHMISKMKDNEKSRIAVITNSSPLFIGDAGSGESEIRKWIIENDYLEAIIGLPNQLFFNTGIKTYIWILTNQKESKRKRKIQLIDATEEYEPMKKNLGNKRHQISENNIHNILKYYKLYEEGDKVKILDNNDFGYTKITIERPKQLNYCVNKRRINNLYSYSQFKKLSESNSKDIKIKQKEEQKGKEKQEKVKQALFKIPSKLYKNWDEFEIEVKKVLEPFNFKPSFIKNVIEKLSEHDDTADYVIDKKGNKKADSNLRDYEKIPLKEDVDEYLKEEVFNYYPDAWIDNKKNKIGYEINFTKYFYVYEKPRSLDEINKDIKDVTSEISRLLDLNHL